MKRTVKNLLITLGVELMAGGFVFWYESCNMEISGNLFRMLSDAFFVSGAITFCIGLMFVVSNGGGLDAFAYMGKKIKHFWSRERKEPFIKYDEFLKERHERGKVSTGHLLTGAGIFIFAGAVFAFMAG
ncbi:MAG: DUF3899 domain-containing protein [Butyrivibrio sp.]